jgi:ribosomal-protein-alanine N-acetyltransferase
MFTLETPRLVIRPFSLDDLDVIHRILDIELADGGADPEGAEMRHRRAEWLRWTILGYEQFASLHQPPYGERAVVLKRSGLVIGACGYVPRLDRFGQIPGLSTAAPEAPVAFTTTELGLYYAISSAYQRLGHATEAARAMIDYAFGELSLVRIVATTTYDNAASIGVMRKLGMRIEKNPLPDPPWLQIVGALDNPRLRR